MIKLDIEGAEALALKGAEKILAEIRPVFYIEIADHTSAEVSSIFHDFGYDLFKLEADGGLTPIQHGCLYTIAKPTPIGAVTQFAELKLMAPPEMRTPYSRNQRTAITLLLLLLSWFAAKRLWQKINTFGCLGQGLEALFKETIAVPAVRLSR